MRIYLIALIIGLSTSCTPSTDKDLNQKIRENASYKDVKDLSLEVVRSGFNAGDGYGEVWIRDFNTFIELSAEVNPSSMLLENLLVFFRLQGTDGNIPDGFIPVDKATGGYNYTYSSLEPRYAGHKNTVETDQESSLVQALYKYVNVTSDTSILQTVVGDTTVAERLEKSLEYVMTHRFNQKFGLVYGATTADWGDVQPEHEWGVFLTENTNYAIDVYDNAMFLIALDNFMALIPAKREKWQKTREQIASNVMKYLWDAKDTKFIPHLYLDQSPFPNTFDENSIYYHGGTAVAIEAGLLNKEQVGISLNKMIENVRASGAFTIGLTLYPPYPEKFFANSGMYPYGYQNGGDWDWFGGRMIQQLVRYGYIQEAVEQLQPMLDRAIRNEGFFEWYTIHNEPKGSGTFRGSAGVLYKSIVMLENWAKVN